MVTRKRFKTTRMFIKNNPRDSRITSIVINKVEKKKIPYIIVFGKKMYITESEKETLTTTTIYYE